MRSDEIAPGCTGKKRFDTFSLATRVARRSRRSKSVRLQVYRCRKCRGFHVGTNSTRDYGHA